MSPRRLKTDPVILEMASQKIAVVQGKGSPDKVFAKIFPALFGSVYTLKFDLKKRGLESFKVSCPRARFPNAHLYPTHNCRYSNTRQHYLPTTETTGN